MSVLPSHNDCKALFDAIAREDEASFKIFFERYKGKVYSQAYKWTKSNFAAEEITQDVFISIWTGRAHLTAVKDADAYFYTVIYNKISRHLKKEANKMRILRLSLWNAKESCNDTEEMVYANEGHRFMNKALAQLSPQKKTIFELSRKEGKSYDEIAETLHLSPHTVKSHLVQAVKFVRNYMKNNAVSIVWMLATLLCKKNS
jgi:RNA polymerase sigma-70 factor (family 1)